MVACDIESHLDSVSNHAVRYGEALFYVLQFDSMEAAFDGDIGEAE